MLPDLALPKLDAMPDPVGRVDYGGPAGELAVEIDLVRGTGRAGAVPQLRLRYGSRRVDGTFGRGWSLSLPSISRGAGRRAVRYRDGGAEADGYTASEHGELVPRLVESRGRRLPDVRVSDGFEVMRFRPRVEAAFARIERWRELATGALHWRETSREGVTRIYGRSAECRIADPADALRVAQWLLEEERDPLGHVLTCVYKAEDAAGVTPGTAGERGGRAAGSGANRHPKRVLWGNAVPGEPGGEAFELVFDYGEHDAARPTPTERRPWALRPDPRSTYRTGFELRTRRLCRRVLLFHRLPEPAAGPLLIRAHELTYDSDEERSLLVGVTLAGFRHERGEVQRAELPALRLGYSGRPAPGPARVLADERAAPAQGSGGHWIDLDGDGLPGLLRREAGGAITYRANLGAGRLAAPAVLPSRPATTDARAGAGPVLAQPFGDAHTCLLDLGNGPGYHDRAPSGRWAPFVPFPAVRTNVDRTGRSLDLDGDGLADTLQADPGGVRWQRFDGREGWSTEEASPSPAAAATRDRSGTVLVADMSGDGLPDLVQVQPGRVRYWPNLGHGRFGEEVEMSAAPQLDGPDGFDPARVRLADTDGSGSADLIYLGRDGVVEYANHAGNACGEGRRLTSIGPLGDLADVVVLDVTGSGTASLVWTSTLPGEADRPIHFLELTGGELPYVLTSVEDGRGLTTTVTYTTSTRLMLADRAAGHPWATSVPFALPVVAEVRQTDEVTGGVVVSSFDYRHGCYDDVARELRGFGYVARRDVELPPADPAGLTPTPPVREVRTWYHAGLDADGIPVAERLVADFFAGDPARPGRPGVAVEALAGVPAREVLRALQGRPIREEVYGLGDDPASVCPRSTTDYGYLLRVLQPSGEPAPPAVAAFERETVRRIYEQVPDDPRTEHVAALAIDEAGNVTREATISYARRRPEVAEQARPIALLSEREVLNRDADAGSYRLGLPVSERRFELGPLPAARHDLHAFDDLLAFLADPRLRDVPFEEELDARGPPQRRSLAVSEVRYWDDALAGVERRGRAGRLALPAFERHAAMTDSLARATYGDGAAATLREAGYALAGGLWWSAGPLVRYDARAFGLPVSSEGPLRGTRTIEYDVRSLLAVRERDEIGNEQHGEPDYQALELASLEDANGAVGRVGFGPFGLPATLRYAERASDPPRPPALRVERDLLAWQRARAAPSVRVTGRPRGDAGADEEEVEVRLLDARGRELERARRDEPDPETAAERWASEGRVVRTSAGAVVRQYAASRLLAPDLRPEAALTAPAVRSKIDELGRTLETHAPDGTRARTRRTAWRVEQWDPVDWLRGSEWEALRLRADAPADERAAAVAAAELAGTPTVEILDPAGRTVVQVQDLGSGRLVRTRVSVDAGGELASLTDPRGIEAESRTRDMLGRVIRLRSSASGETRTLFDAEGRQALTWGARRQRERHRYDAAGRLVERLLATSTGRWRVTERRVYGDELGIRDRFCRGRVRFLFDGAGLVSLAYDHQGNTVRAERALRAEIASPVDWSALQDVATEAELRARAAPLLGERLPSTMSYDDLGRLLARTHPDGTEARMAYGARALPATVTAVVAGRERRVLESASYDAAGRRLDVRLGNGVRETAAYEDATGRLRRLTTSGPGGRLRDQTLTFDPVGNLTSVRDAAQQTLFFANAAVSPDRRFAYDALYRLVSAEGREATGTIRPDRPGEPAGAPLPAPNDLRAVRRYAERYEYDAAGNLSFLEHVARDGSFAVRYELAADADRVARLTDRRGTAFPGSFAYDEAGNALTLGALSGLHWDDEDRLARVELGGGGTAYHAYDAEGKRVHTVVERRGGLREERVRLDGWDRWRRTTTRGEVDSEVTTLHVGDDRRMLALVEQRRSRAARGTTTAWRYQHVDHAGSIALETGADGGVVTFEELRPYGGSAYRAAVPTMPPKRYRFRGAERDDETGLDLHGVRSYVPWLGRWISPDPGGMLDGPNRYWFARSNPVTYSDPSGYQACSQEARFTPAPPEPVFTPAAQVVSAYHGGLGIPSVGVHDPTTRASLPIGAFHPPVPRSYVIPGGDAIAPRPPVAHHAPPAASRPPPRHEGATAHSGEPAANPVRAGTGAAAPAAPAPAAAQPRVAEDRSPPAGGQPHGGRPSTEPATEPQGGLGTALRGIARGILQTLVSLLPAHSPPPGFHGNPVLAAHASMERPAESERPRSEVGRQVGIFNLNFNPIVRVVRSYQAYRAAARAGDLEEASRQGTFFVLDALPIVHRVASWVGRLPRPPAGPSPAYAFAPAHRPTPGAAAVAAPARRPAPPSSAPLWMTAAAGPNRPSTPGGDAPSPESEQPPAAPPSGGTGPPEGSSPGDWTEVFRTMTGRARLLQDTVDAVHAELARQWRPLGRLRLWYPPPWKLTVGGAYSEIGGRPVTIITVSHPNAWLAIRGFVRLPPGVELQTTVPLLDRTRRLLQEHHTEVMATTEIEARGAGGSIITTNRPACRGFCQPRWTNLESQPATHIHFNIGLWSDELRLLSGFGP